MKTKPSLLMILAFLICALSPFALGEEKRLNILVITVDDMSADSLGSFGCLLPETSPHVDQLASEGLCFDRAHVQVGNCFPSRNVMWSGRYPHNSGVEGFYQVKPIDFPVLCDVMQNAGYWVGIRGKVSHSTPYQPFHWDEDLTLLPDGKKEHLKDVESYYRSTKRGIEAATGAGKPFCLNINISDPHKPFWFPNDKHPASKEFSAEEVPIPGYLVDDPAIREELALYYTSVRRADDAVGAILRALEESGAEENTFIMFLSDHGMPLPFAKTQLYHHSTLTPLIIKWPGVTKPGTRDQTHMVSAVDFLPTLCEVIGADLPEGLDGHSFEPLLRGEIQDFREAVFKVYNENSGRNRHPMRGIQNERFLYLFNPWSDGENQFKTATQGTVSYKRLKALAETNPEVAARVELFDHRVVEELYDIRNDPDCLNNLIGSPEHTEALAIARNQLERFMTESGDHALEPFLNRDDPDARISYMAKVSAEAAARSKAVRDAKRKAKEKSKGKN
ncbi:MAG: sulfatase [Verrucomicrobiota bacterium]